MATSQTITLRLRIADPVPGVTYSLQNKKGAPVGWVMAGEEAITFDVPVRLAPGPKFLGDFVRSEGPDRRFVYIAIGAQAGQHHQRREQADGVGHHDPDDHRAGLS